MFSPHERIVQYIQFPLGTIHSSSPHWKECISSLNPFLRFNPMFRLTWMKVTPFICFVTVVDQRKTCGVATCAKAHATNESRRKHCICLFAKKLGHYKHIKTVLGRSAVIQSFHPFVYTELLHYPLIAICSLPSPNREGKYWIWWSKWHYFSVYQRRAMKAHSVCFCCHLLAK